MRELDKLKIDKADAIATRDDVFELRRIIRDLQHAKTPEKSNDEVVRQIHAKRRDIFSPVLLDVIDMHISSKSLTKELNKGHYGLVVNSYLDKIVNDVTVPAYAIKHKEKVEEKEALKNIISLYKQKVGKKDDESEPAAKKVKWAGPASAKDSTKSDSTKPTRPFTKRPFVPGPKSILKPGYASVGAKPNQSPAAVAMTTFDDLFSNDFDMQSETENVESEETGGEEIINDQLLAMQQQISSLAKATAYSLTQSPTSNQVLSNTESDVQATIDLVKTMKLIDKIKNEACTFTHRNPTVKHRLWECTLPQLQKIEELTKRNQCRICWDEGHTGLDCTSKVVVMCDYCKKTGHWQPFCGSYISKMYQERMQKFNDRKEAPAAAASVDSNSEKETMDQYNARITNQAIHQSRIENANAQLSQHFSLISGSPLGPAPQFLPNSSNS
jgi:DNA polymerase III delta prime subunit